MADSNVPPPAYTSVPEGFENYAAQFAARYSPSREVQIAAAESYVRALCEKIKTRVLATLIEIRKPLRTPKDFQDAQALAAIPAKDQTSFWKGLLGLQERNVTFGFYVFVQETSAVARLTFEDHAFMTDTVSKHASTKIPS